MVSTFNESAGGNPSIYLDTMKIKLKTKKKKEKLTEFRIILFVVMRHYVVAISDVFGKHFSVEIECQTKFIIFTFSRKR